ncbi:MAG TPA: bifunctional phosphoribosylaminoimidazolecarboxamide formyltransferase/IMP cyclohydrolase [Aestuariivirgaceae bacterium]|jgi:phosphoribosylaminoimidazolecarboxamide formyltransferase/IMP cyclohydrolase
MTQLVRRALLSVSDKNGLADFARSLHGMGIELISTGGTAKFLRSERLPVTDVSELTGSAEILGGRVKTLHPNIHAALLAKSGDVEHQATLQRLGIKPIELLIVNLYPFESVIQSDAAFEDCIEHIDIGGPAMIRAAAKNHSAVAVVTDPDDYTAILEELRANSSSLTLPTRKRLAAKAFARTAVYDAAVSNWFIASTPEQLPDYFAIGGKCLQKLRYGENPHQTAALYSTAGVRSGIPSARQIQGKELSYNNINDADAAWQCASEFAHRPSCVIVKHANPCGVALADSLLDAYSNAFRCDPVSAFGGIIVLTRSIDAATAEAIVKVFTEVIVAPDVSEAARKIIAGKQNLRLLLAPFDHLGHPGLAVKTISGGLLVQTADAVALNPATMRVVSKRQPRVEELADLEFAFTVAKHVKSNAVVYAKNLATVGIGAGQMSRLDASRIASQKASHAAAQQGLKTSLSVGSVAASDAFFPFPDAVHEIAAAGATAVIHPGGSLRDDEIIAAADETGLAMVFTEIRHFRH